MSRDLPGRARAFLIEEHLLSPEEAGQALDVAATVLGEALGRLAAAVAAGDTEACAAVAHGLKGNLLNLGLSDLAAVAEEAVVQAGRGDVAAVAAVWRTLAQALAPLARTGPAPA